ncbi:MAG: cytochrome P450 [Opitutus sp.]
MPPEAASGNPSVRKISLLTFLRWRHNPLELFSRLATSPNTIDYVRIGKKTVVLVKHPDLVQQLLVASTGRVVKGRTRERARFFRFLGAGLLNAEGDEQRRQRRLMLPAFHRARLAGYADAMVACSTAATREWRHGEVTDVGETMMQLTLTIVARTLFSSDVKDTAGKFAAAFSELTSNLNRFLFPGAAWLLRLPLPFARRIDASQHALDELVYTLIRDRRATGGDTGDLLSMLLLAKDEERPEEGLSDLEVRDQTMTLFFAGHETTANALTWTCWLLAKHPEIQDRLSAELVDVLNGREPGFDDMPQLAFTEQIVREALRLYPPVWTLARRTVAEVNLNGFVVPPDSLVLASQWIFHRNPQWFPDPLEFKPERWTNKFRSTLPRFAYFPFGGGSRSCVGENFAWMEFILVVASLAQRWRFSMASNSDRVTPLARITLHPDRPVLLKLERKT